MAELPDLPFEVTEAIMLAVVAAVGDMDPDPALTLIESYGAPGVWLAVCGFAELMHQVMFADSEDDGHGSFFLEVYADGERVDARDAAEDVPHAVLAMQVCSALWNRDLALAVDLWEAADYELRLAAYGHMFGMTVAMTMGPMSN